MTKKIALVHIEHKVMAVIDNFYSELPLITLSKNLSIRRIDTLADNEQTIFAGNEEDIEHFFRSNSDSEYKKKNLRVLHYRSSVGEQLTRTIEQGNHVLYWDFNGTVQEPLKTNYDVFLKPDSEFESVISALRVMKETVVGLYPQEHLFLKVPSLEKFPRATHRSHDGYQLSKPEEMDPYILLSNDVDNLCKLVEAIKNVKQPGLQTALRRLDNQYSRAYISDRLIDAVIALEALYVGEASGELAFRGGLRIATHLGGNNPDERQRCFDLFNLAYNLRSQLVHGAIHNTRGVNTYLKKKDWKDSDSFMSALDNMLRKSLSLILLHVQDGDLKKLLHEPLDLAIKRGEAYTTS